MRVPVGQRKEPYATNFVSQSLGLLLALFPAAALAGETTLVTGPNLMTGRMNHSAIVTAQGKVVLFGGHGPGFTTLDTAEIWTPGEAFWTSVSMRFPHDAPAFARLADGRYFIAGGSSSLGIPRYNTIEVFDPAAGTFTAGEQVLVRFRAASGSVQLTGGKVLLAGAWWVHNEVHTVGELYDPATGVCVATGPLNLARSAPVVLPMTNGDAIVVGGVPPQDGSLLATPERYSAAANMFTKVADEIFPDDPDWRVGATSSAVIAGEDLRMADGRHFIVSIYRTKAGISEQGFALFDTETGAFQRVVTTPTLPDYRTEIFLYNPMLDRARNVAYLFSYLPSSSPPRRALIRTLNLTTGATEALPGIVQFPANYELSAATLTRLPDGRILVAGGATPGTGNFGARANTFLITPGTAGPAVAIDTYAGIAVSGSVGSAYAVEYATALAPETWLPLITVTLTNATQLVFDPNPLSGQAKRFYPAKAAE